LIRILVAAGNLQEEPTRGLTCPAIMANTKLTLAREFCGRGNLVAEEPDWLLGDCGRGCDGGSDGSAGKTWLCGAEGTGVEMPEVAVDLAVIFGVIAALASPCGQVSWWAWWGEREERLERGDMSLDRMEDPTELQAQSLKFKYKTSAGTS